MLYMGVESMSEIGAMVKVVLSSLWMGLFLHSLLKQRRITVLHVF